MDILLTIRAIRFGKNNQKYWNEQTVNAFILCLEQLLIWDSFCYFQEKEDYFFIEDRTTLLEYLLESGGEFRTSKTLCCDKKNSSSFLDISISPKRMDILLSINKIDYQSFEKQIILNLKDFVLALPKVFPNAKEIGREINIDAFQVPFYKMRPPYYYQRWSLHGIVDILDIRNLKQDKGEENRIMKGIAQLPDFVEHEQKGNLHVLTWVHDISNEKVISLRLTERNKWLHQYMELEREPNYNDFGDKIDRNMYLGIDKHPYISYYDSEADAHGDFYGFQTMVILPDGSTDEPKLNNLSKWIKNKQLPNGSPITCLSLIVQDRAAAMLILERSKALGIFSVLYMDDEEQFWNVDPPGMWLN